ncbi:MULTISPECIES: efflux RND transporter periplasmic adaptor subunit [Roseateles]|uniref:Efflux RND transporter periplasmic adaptor subunit n=1 Tax=Roseateles albus TaxID=2987525 RepID=A0ABT5KE24_9BURK|nr:MULTISPECIES: efflux RND transporter periplasmic adaptor subunit [Roseateles]MCV2358495.1 efflux RND transporter periplasmic adaptor subunit [Paucibacter sp. TC2R-5]MDC8772175.1 efflux RND transporter periplasmic adaptor subunit [Roseateles albus]
MKTDLSTRLKTLGWKWQLVLLALLLGLAALAWRSWRGPEVTTSTVLRRDFVQSVVASGRVETPHRADIAAQITGTVARVPVAQGSQVAAGDLLIELESTELRANQRQAELAVQQALARVRQVGELQAPVAEQQLRQAQASLTNAKSQLNRQQALFEQGFIGEAALEQARTTLALTEAQWRLSQKQSEALRPSGSDAALAEAALAQARASAEAAAARAAYARIKAPAAGTLIGRKVEVGDVVQAGKVLMTLSPAGRTQLVLSIDERNLRLIAPGQPALASADAFPDQRFAAKLVYINPGVNAQTGAVEVKLDVPAPPPYLSQDMTVSVDIEVARRPQALLLPLAVVREPQSAAPWVLRVGEDGRARRQNVRLGLRSGGYAELLDGLAEGDRLVLAAEPVKDGARVRSKADAPTAKPGSAALPAGR